MDDKKLTQQPILNIDGTPDENYVLRILQAYRENCNVKWATDTNGSCDNPIFVLMNEHQERRAKLLDAAILKIQSPTVDTPRKKTFLYNYLSQLNRKGK